MPRVPRGRPQPGAPTVGPALVPQAALTVIVEGLDDAGVVGAVTLQPRVKTLTDQEIDAVAGKIVAEVTKKTGGTLRG